MSNVDCTNFRGNDKALIEVFDKYGPVSVSIDASYPNFASYSSGVYGEIPGQCNSSRIGNLNSS